MGLAMTRAALIAASRSLRRSPATSLRAAPQRPASGVWGRSHQAESQRAILCPTLANPKNAPLKTTHLAQRNRHTMHQTKEQLTQFPLITFIKPTATLFLTIATTACQTIGPSHHQTQLNVLKHQRSVIEAVMAERNAPEVSN